MEEKSNEIPIERCYTPAQVAEQLGLSIKEVTKKLRKELGVLKIGLSKPRPGYPWTRTTLRVPESVCQRIKQEWTIK